MGIFDFNKKITETSKPRFVLARGRTKSSEALKGQVETKDTKFSKELGEPHPFDYTTTENLYKSFGLVTGVIDKYVDFIVSGGFYVKAEDSPVGANAETIIQDYFRDVEFDSILRAWLKEALIKGSGYLELSGKPDEVPKELKILDAKWMYVKRNNFGKIENINQLKLSGRSNLRTVSKNDFTSFKPHEIAILNFNKIGDMAYGMGIVEPAIKTINDFLGANNSMHKMLHRKANSPIHAKLGDLDKDIIPTAEDVSTFGKELQTLTNQTEWATGPDVSFSVLDFGNAGDKFGSVMKSDNDILFAAFQVPEVLLGRGNIPEGLAKVQLEAFDRNIKSKQAEIERIIESQIIKRVLIANGIDVHVEFEWGQPSEEDTNTRLVRITELLKLFNISPEMRLELEKESLRLLNLNTELVTPPEEEREEQEAETQPAVPGANRKASEMVKKLKKINEYHFHTEDLKTNYSLKEWLGFNFLEYLTHILDQVRNDNFEMVLAENPMELEAGRLSQDQVDELREVMAEGFAEGKSINDIAEAIDERVKPQDLYRTKDGKMVLDINGKPILALSSAFRGNMIARTESTRLAANGALSNYSDGGIEQVRFLSALSQRTCPECESLNGQIFPLNESFGLIPVHSMCRCTFTPVTLLD
jgi:SPP1 gp7 family putative phage head morphogenesis protein